MNSFECYRQYIKINQVPLEGNYVAYKMDDTHTESNMRKDAGLGTCHCCDYFLLGEDTNYLLENTALYNSIHDQNEIYRELDVDTRTKLVQKILLQENYLKVYGSLLTLCRLSNKQGMLPLDRYIFWFVIDDKAGAKSNHRFLDNFRNKFFGDLRSLLASTVVKDVQFVPADELPEKLIESNLVKS